jgi:uncharacterized membrane protein YhiD involved in acid resistance
VTHAGDVSESGVTGEKPARVLGRVIATVGFLTGGVTLVRRAWTTNAAMPATMATVTTTAMRAARPDLPAG